jgi:hypothetical protein
MGPIVIDRGGLWYGCNPRVPHAEQKKGAKNPGCSVAEL